MGYDRKAPRKPVNLSLDEELVRQARQFSQNLSGTVEELLEGFVRRAQARRRMEDEAIDRVIGATNALHARHGFLSDEFSAL